MNKTEEWIVKTALGYLAYDDAFPQVGMGMHCGTAVDLAIDDAAVEARTFNGTLGEFDREAIYEAVRKARK